MIKHAKDKREHLYTYEELEQGQTYDIYWNAAQIEMVQTNVVRIFFRNFCTKNLAA